VEKVDIYMDIDILTDLHVVRTQKTKENVFGISCVYVLAACRYAYMDRFYPCLIFMSLSVRGCQANMYILVKSQDHFINVHHTQNTHVLCNVSTNFDARELSYQLQELTV
jgi:hypothetical protein